MSPLIIRTSVADPGLFGHLDPKEKKRIQILKELNIDQNHKKIIPKLSKRRLFFLNSAILQYSILIFGFGAKLSGSATLIRV